MESKKSKKYFMMFEMHHCVNFSSVYVDTIEAARVLLFRMIKRNDPFVERLAVGYWEEIPFEEGNMKIFHICFDFRKIKK